MRCDITREEIESIYKEGMEAVIELVLRLLSIIRELEEEIQRLKEILSKDSHNSHKPPSSDGLKKRRRSLRERSGNKPGGKEGHKGETLRMRDEPDRIVSHHIEVCSFCGSCLKWVESRGYERRQVFEIPKFSMEVIEHRAEIKVCPNCGRKNKAKFKEDVKNHTQYGMRVKSIVLIFKLSTSTL